MRTLRDVCDADGSRYLGIQLDARGDLFIVGRDFGAVVERFFGQGVVSYAWIWRVRARHVGRISSALGGHPDGVLDLLAQRFRGPAASELCRFLEWNDIPFERWSRFGD